MILSGIAEQHDWPLVQRPNCVEIAIGDETLRVFAPRGHRPGFFSIMLVDQRDMLPEHFCFFAKAQLARVKYHTSQLVLQENQLSVVLSLDDSSEFMLYDLIERFLNEVDFWKNNLNP